jgi:hypothetical protein
VAVRVDVQPGVGQQAGHEPGRDVVHVGASSPVEHPGTGPSTRAGPVRRGLSAIGDAVPVEAPAERASPRELCSVRSTCRCSCARTCSR